MLRLMPYANSAMRHERSQGDGPSLGLKLNNEKDNVSKIERCPIQW